MVEERDCTRLHVLHRIRLTRLVNVGAFNRVDVLPQTGQLAQTLRLLVGLIVTKALFLSLDQACQVPIRALHNADDGVVPSAIGHLHFQLQMPLNQALQIQIALNVLLLDTKGLVVKLRS